MTTTSRAEPGQKSALNGLMLRVAVQSATLWGTNLLITLTLLTMIDMFGVGQVFWIYGAFNVAAWLFVWRLMPELTGHSLEDIEKHLQDGEFRPQDFRQTA